MWRLSLWAPRISKLVWGIVWRMWSGTMSLLIFSTSQNLRRLLRYRRWRKLWRELSSSISRRDRLSCRKEWNAKIWLWFWSTLRSVDPLSDMFPNRWSRSTNLSTRGSTPSKKIWLQPMKGLCVKSKSVCKNRRPAPFLFRSSLRMPWISQRRTKVYWRRRCR